MSNFNRSKILNEMRNIWLLFSCSAMYSFCVSCSSPEPTKEDIETAEEVADELFDDIDKSMNEQSEEKSIEIVDSMETRRREYEEDLTH